MAHGAAASTSAQNIAAAEKAAQATALRAKGMTFAEIARQVGYADRSGAQRAVAGVLASLGQEEAATLRAEQAEQIDEVLAVVLPYALTPPADVREDDDEARTSRPASTPVMLQAVDRVVRLWERRARLLGLDAPASMTSTLEVGESVAEVIEPTQTRTLGDVLGLDTDEARQFARLVAPILARRKAAEQPHDEKGAQLVSTPEEPA